jgi:plasmid maintenance system killer protein
MTASYSKRFLKQYTAAPVAVRKAFDKQAILQLENLHHPSLHAKKYNEALDLWQARVNRDWRFYFTIEGETCYLHEIVKHPK